MTEQRARQVFDAGYGRPVPSLRRSVSGLGCGCAGVGDFTLPVLVWPQISVSLIVGLGLGYVLFAKK